MKTIQALREERKALAKEVSDLMAKKDWSVANDQPVYDAKMAEIDSVDQQIMNIERANKLFAEQQLNEQVADRAEQRGRDEKAPALAAFATFLRKDVNEMSAEELQTFRNTMSTTTGSQGGYTVPTEVAAVVVDRLAAYGNMRKYATVLKQSSGADMNWPTSDGTSEVGEQIGQNTTANAADVTFGQVTISTYKYSSKIVTVPIELLQDSVVDIEAFVGQRLAKRLGRITNTKYSIGAGTTEPNGVVTAASVGRTGAAGQVASIIWDDLVELEHSVDAAYRELGNCRFMGHDSMIKTVKKIKDTAGRPIFIPGYADGYAGGFKDSILGYEVAVNNSMAVPAASAKSLIFGDLSEYVIRDIMDVSLFRFTDSVYTTKGQVGFLAWMRSGGNLVDVNAVMSYQHPAS